MARGRCKGGGADH